MKNKIEIKQVEFSAPCRIDMGGTLDISTFHLPLRQYKPCTFNIAIDLRTRVRIIPFKKGWVRITSNGFEPYECASDDLSFNHPLGLMCAISSYFGADGVHIDIHSTSPPRSALGGSSVAGVALVAAFLRIENEQYKGVDNKLREKSALIAHAIESSVAGVPCGLQDQLAAAYGGVNAWYWTGKIIESSFLKKEILNEAVSKDIQQHILVAYCGQPHESKNVNGKWVNTFLTGIDRKKWIDIIQLTENFANAISEKDFKKAKDYMNLETDIRCEMTPEVLDNIGRKLVDSAVICNCGARFTGAGGGGCIWAVGEKSDLNTLKNNWSDILKINKDACFLTTDIDYKGIIDEKN